MNNKLMSYKDMLSTETIGEISSNIDMFYNLSYKLSTYIFDYRINHKLSQKDFAKTIGVKQAMVSKLESGDYNISLESICNVMAKLIRKWILIFNLTKLKTQMFCLTIRLIDRPTLIMLVLMNVKSWRAHHDN